MGAAKIYPTNGEYNTAVENLPVFARNPLLAGAVPRRSGPHRRLVAYSGGYSRVYPVDVGSRTFALRCWTADVGDARERYRRIGEYLDQTKLPYFVEFRYLDDAIVVKGHAYPVLWMEWAAGPRLREHVGSVIGNAGAVTAVAEAFRAMVGELHRTEISHGDLQDENIIVQLSASGPELRLIDYDGLFVPALRNYDDQIIGVSHYQHPQRGSLRRTSERVDHFSELVIYLSLLAYAQNPALWNPQHEKRLFFTDTDFTDPDASDAFQALRYMTGEVRRLTECLVTYCREQDITGLPPLEAVLGPAPGGASSPRRTDAPLLEVPEDLLSGAPRPGAARAMGPVIAVPDDLLLTQPARPRRPAGPLLAVPDDFLNGASPPHLVLPPVDIAVPTGFLTHVPPGAGGGSGDTPPTVSAPPDEWEDFLQPRSRNEWEAFYAGAERSATSRGARTPAPGTPAAPAPRRLPTIPPPRTQAPPRPVVPTPAVLSPQVQTPPPATVRRSPPPVSRKETGSNVAVAVGFLILLLLLFLIVSWLVGQTSFPTPRVTSFGPDDVRTCIPVGGEPCELRIESFRTATPARESETAENAIPQNHHIKPPQTRR